MTHFFSSASATAMMIALASSASAQALTDRIVTDLSAQGYEYIEIETGPTQTRVEAIRGTEVLEAVFDNSTGEVIVEAMGTTDDDEDEALEIEESDEDFVDPVTGAFLDDDEDDDDEDDEDDEDDDDEDDDDDDDDDEDDDDDNDDEDDDDDDDDDEDEDEDEDDEDDEA